LVRDPNPSVQNVRPIPLGLSKIHLGPNSDPDHLHVGHRNVYRGATSLSCSTCSIGTTANIEPQDGTGHEKQFLAHLGYRTRARTNGSAVRLYVDLVAYSPGLLRPHASTGNLEQTIRTKVGGHFLDDAGRAPDRITRVAEV
jgi:hypothetical protein